MKRKLALWPKPLFAFAVTILGSIALLAPASGAARRLDNPKAPLSVTANRVFGDDFNTAPVAAPDGLDARGTPTCWRTSLWFGSGYARQGGGQGYYADTGKNSRWFQSVVDANPFTVDHGILSITARPQDITGFPALHYVTGILTTINSFYMDYGYFEIRAKCP
ncbi:MAG: hypothetical protein M3Y28_07535, partial [Armatimonadota bacterium]|nr:hypothetical protein [Armatimonadota bacterium]